MNRKKIIWIVIMLALLAFLLKYSDSILGFFSMAANIARPLVLGCAAAYVLNILVARIEKIPCFKKEGTVIYKIRRPVSILGAIAVIIALMALVILIVIPQLTQAIGVLVQEIPKAVSRLVSWADSSDRNWPQLQSFLESLDVDWPRFFQKAAEHLSSGLSNIFSSTVYVLRRVGSMIVTLVVALIFSIYILSGKEKLFLQFKTLAKTYLKEKYYARLALVLRTAHDTFTRYIVGQCTEAVILGCLCTAGMFILRFPYAGMVGTLIGATAILPVVGAYLGAFVGAFMIFTVDPVKAVGFLVFIVILQQIEGNLIYPRVVGSSVGLPGIWVLAAVTVGGGFGGILGMLLAVPVTATVYKLIQKDVHKRQGEIRI
ncbi:MAG: AI-2E family transporter [Ruminococcus sp.]